MSGPTQYKLNYLWGQYVELFKENTQLISFITNKGFTMSDVTQTPGLNPEDPITSQMATAFVALDNEVKASGDEFATKPAEVQKRYVQTADMIHGDPVEEAKPFAM